MVEFSDLFESEAEEFQKKAKVGFIPSGGSSHPQMLLEEDSLQLQVLTAHGDISSVRRSMFEIV